MALLKGLKEKRYYKKLDRVKNEIYMDKGHVWRESYQGADILDQLNNIYTDITIHWMIFLYLHLKQMKPKMVVKDISINFMVLF